MKMISILVYCEDTTGRFFSLLNEYIYRFFFSLTVFLLCFSYLQHHFFLSHGYFFYFFKWYGIFRSFISNIMKTNKTRERDGEEKKKTTTEEKNKRKQLFGSHFITAHCFFFSFQISFGYSFHNDPERFKLIAWSVYILVSLPLSISSTHTHPHCRLFSVSESIYFITLWSTSSLIQLMNVEKCLVSCFRYVDLFSVKQSFGIASIQKKTIWENEKGKQKRK